MNGWDELRRLAEAATPGPYVFNGYPFALAGADAEFAIAAANYVLRLLATTTPPQEPAIVEIRATHVYGFRSGEWAIVTGLEWRNDRPCYQVRFPDGVTDSWVVADPSDPYEFRGSE